MGQAVWKSYGWRWAIGGAILIGIWFLYSLVNNGLVRKQLFQSLNNARLVHMCIQSASLDNPQLGFPADSECKSSHEYIQLLVKKGVLKISDLKLLAGPGQTPATSLETITPEHIGFRFANVSARDPANTIFIVSSNLVTDGLTLRPDPHGFIVFYKSGDGTFYSQTQNKVPSNTLGDLPPREPKFLAP